MAKSTTVGFVRLHPGFVRNIQVYEQGLLIRQVLTVLSMLSGALWASLSVPGCVVRH